jgi:hypothetical protein
MSRREKCVLWAVAIAVLTGVTSAILFGRGPVKPAALSSEELNQSRSQQRFRNLSLQPEAAAVNRRLGKRFKSGGERTVSAGNLIQDGAPQTIAIIRNQTDTGETVELMLPSRLITWNGTEGVKAIGSAPTEAERLLTERLVFDSADQFVLAQLRGASYQTIVRNLRPTDAGDDYAGPLWTMIRVDDPETTESASPTSRWRLYYINSKSGLIDRVECDLDGQRVAASILQWTELNGERIPAHIRWTTSGRTLMEYQLTSFSQGQ